MVRQCISYNETLLPSQGDTCSQISPTTNKSLQRCVHSDECSKKNGLCCDGFCYFATGHCQDGYLYCDVTKNCVHVLTGRCGRSCPPPKVYCLADDSCTFPALCSGTFNGGKAWTVMPLVNSSLVEGFYLEDTWIPLNYTKGSYNGVFTVISASSDDHWETYESSQRRWVQIRDGQTLATRSRLRITRASFGVAELILFDRVNRSLLYYVPPPTRLANRFIDNSAVRIMDEDEECIIDMTSFSYPTQEPVNGTHLKIFWSDIQSKALSLDTSSAILKNLWKFVRDGKTNTGWIVELYDRPRKYSDIKVALEYSFDSGKSWLEMEAAQPLALSDGHFLLRVIPRTNFVGTVRLALKPYPTRGHNDTNPVVNLTFTYKPVNDLPVPRLDIREDQLPYLTWNQSNLGFTANDLALQMYSDPDDSQLGLVLLYAQSSRLGRWQFSRDGGHWTDILTLNQHVLDENCVHFPYVGPFNQVSCVKNRTRVPILILKPDDRLRFARHNASHVWSTTDAILNTKLVFTVWDVLTNESNVTGDINLPICTSRCGHQPSMSPIASLFYMETSDCSDQRGSYLKVVDQCGVCGGDGSSCQGCQNGSNCNKCIPTVENFKNCAFHCNNQADYLNNGSSILCPPQDMKKPRHCNETLDSFVNKCGFCVGGNTGLKKNTGMDACGVCFGSNQTCFGCGDIFNSVQSVSTCDQCVHPNVSNLARCGWMTLLIDIIYGTRQIVSIGDTFGLSEDIVLSGCSILLVNGSREIKVEKSVLVDRRIELTVNGLNPGIYSVVCHYLNKSKGFQTQQKMQTKPHLLRIVDSNHVNCSSIVPKQITAGVETSIQIYGTQFSKYDQLECLYKQDGYPVQRLIAVDISENVIVCENVTLPFAVPTQFAVSLGDFRIPDINRLFEKLSTLDIHVVASSPRISKTLLNDKLDLLTIYFDQNVEGPDRCDSIFEKKTLHLFGPSVLCSFQTNQLRILLGSFHSVRDNTSLYFLPKTKIHRKGSSPNSSHEFGDAVAIVQSPIPLEIPFIAIEGSDSVCIDSLTLYSIGGMNAIYRENSSVTWKLTPQNRSNSSVLGNSREWKLDSNGLDIGKTYTLSAEVRFHLLSQLHTAEVYKTIWLTDSFTVSISGPYVVYPKRSYLFTTLIYGCKMMNDSDFRYEWSINGTGIVKRTNGPKIELPDGIVGGRIYKLTCRVFLNQNLSVINEGHHHFYAVDNGIQAKITTFTQTVGSEGFLLDGRASKDWTNAPGQLHFLWRCRQTNGRECFVSKPGSFQSLEVSMGLLRMQRAVLVVGDVLPPADYVFTLAVYKGTNYFSQDSCVVQIHPGNYPQIVIEPQKRAEIPVKITCFYPCHVYWSVIPEAGTNYELLAEYRNSYYSPSNFSELSIPLKLPKIETNFDNITFGLRLTVQHLDTKRTTSYSGIHLEMNGQPLGGELIAEPKSGEAFLQPFHFQVRNSSDRWEDLPLSFQFGYRFQGSRSFIWITSVSYQSEMTLRLPATPSGTFIVPAVQVCDARGACSVMESVSISMTNPLVITDDELEEFLQEIAELTRHFLYIEALASWDTLLSTFNISSAWKKNVQQLIQDSMAKGLSYYATTCSKDFHFRKESHDFSKLAIKVSRVVNNFADVQPKLTQIQQRTLKQRRTSSEMYQRENRIPDLDEDDVLQFLQVMEATFTSNTSITAKQTIVAHLYNYIDALCSSELDVAVNSSTISIWSRSVSRNTDLPTRFPISLHSSQHYFQLSRSYSLVAENPICLTSMEFTVDYLTDSSDLIHVPKWPRITNVVYVKMTGPDDVFRTLKPVTMTFSLNFTNETIKTQRIMCWTWLENQWNDSACTVRYPSILQPDERGLFVDCLCTDFGFYAAFVAEKPAVQDPFVKWIIIQLPSDRKISDPADQLEFQSSLRQQLSNILKISVDAFTQMQWNGTTGQWKFQMISPYERNNLEVERAYDQLSRLLANGGLQLNDLRGNPVIVPAQTVQGQLLSTRLSSTLTALIIASLCALTLLLITVGIVWKNKRKQKKIEPSPSTAAAAAVVHTRTADWLSEKRIPSINLHQVYDRSTGNEDVDGKWAVFRQDFSGRHYIWTPEGKVWFNEDTILPDNYPYSIPEAARYRKPNSFFRL